MEKASAAGDDAKRMAALEAENKKLTEQVLLMRKSGDVMTKMKDMSDRMAALKVTKNEPRTQHPS